MYFLSTRSRWIKITAGLIFFWTTSLAQVVRDGRLEFELPDNEEKFKSVGLWEQGIMLYRQGIRNNNNVLELLKVDTTLRIVWKGQTLLENNEQVLRVQYHGDKLYFLLKAQGMSIADFQIMVVDPAVGTGVRYPIKNMIPFQPVEFLVTNEAALIGGYFNYRPIVLYFSFTIQRARILPGFFNEPGELDQLKADEDGSIDVVVSARNFEKVRCLWIRNYDSGGELVKTTIIQPEKQKNLIFGHSVKLDNGNQIVTGVYGRYSNAEYSRGIFVSEINPFGEYSIKYYNFAQLKNFFSYMKVKRQKRIKDRIDRRTVSGKKIKFNYRLTIHDIIPYKDQYILTGEAFYPKYVFPNQYSSMHAVSPMNGRYGFSSYRNDMVFDGYQYTHAVVIGIDKAGKIVWDNSFEINDVKTMELQQFVKVKPEKDRIVLMYLYSNKLRTKIIKDSEVLEGKNEDTLGIDLPPEKVTSSLEGEQLDYWYGNYIFAFGTEKITYPSKVSKRVVYLTKIYCK